MYEYTYKTPITTPDAIGMSYYFNLYDNRGSFGSLRFDVFEDVCFVNPIFTRLNKKAAKVAKEAAQHICRWFCRDTYEFDYVIVYTKNRKLADILTDRQIEYLGDVNATPVYTYDIR